MSYRFTLLLHRSSFHVIVVSVLAIVVKVLSAFSLYESLYSGAFNLAIKIHSMLKLETRFKSESDFFFLCIKGKVKF